MKPRLCIVTPVHWKAFMGGAQYQIKCLLGHLRELDRYDIHYLAHRAPHAIELDGYRIHKIGGAGPMPRLGYVQDGPALLRTLKKLQPDLIYQRVGGAYTGLAAMFAQRHGCPMVWHAANDTDVLRGLKVSNTNRLRGWVDRTLLTYGIRHADCIVTQTRHQDALLRENFGRDSTAVIANFHPQPVSLPDKSGPLRVIWVANFKRSKQPEVFVRLAQSLEDVAGVRFAMIGAMEPGARNSSWFPRLKREIETAQNIEFLGPLQQEQVNAEIGKSHVFVNTSLYEGFANTFIQAWMRRTVVVSLGVNPDGVFDDDAVGLFAGSEARLAHQVRSMLGNPDLRNAIANRAQAHAVAFHSMNNAAQLERILAGALRAPSRAAGC